ncbi:MAG: hypothetical protein IKF95_03235 [Firmicutes bacterium]|nr:hypothetical protein [Bacillota bacterium]
MSDQLEVDALETLIKAVQKYKDELEINKQILVNAADVCDQAMGSDDIAKKHISRLNEALVELDKTVELTQEVVEALIKDKNMAVSVYED